MYKQGDELKLCARPEWGVGLVKRVETVTHDDKRDQRVWVKFSNVGMKTLLASAAEVELLNSPTEDDDDEHTFAAREHAHESGWLGAISKTKPEEAMISLAPGMTDPFCSVRIRLERTLAMYRFAPTGGSLIDWSVAQSGLEDPLSRFNRHELEAFFKRWACDRDRHLKELMTEARRNGERVDDLLQTASQHARKALTEPHVQR